jgi:hypothetical protein
MKTAVKSSESAVYRRGLGIFLIETPLTAAPKHLFRPLFPRNPHFPALRSVPMAVSEGSRQKQIPSSLFQKAPAKSKFLAARWNEWFSITADHKNEHKAWSR